MAYIYINGFESGVFDASGDELYTFVSTPPPDSSSTVRSGTGSLSMRCTPTGATTRFFRLESAIIGTTQVISGAFYIRRSANTGGTRDIFLVKSVSGLFPKFQVSAAGNFSLHDGTTGGFGVTALTLDQWYRVEFLFDYSNNPWNIAWKLDGVDKTGSTPGNAASNVEYVAPGISSADSTADYYIDDLVLANTAADYGTGAIYIKGYVPEAVGTHNLDAATSLFFFKNTGSDIALTTSETTSWEVIDDVPLSDGTDYLLVKPDGVTEPTNTWYAEYHLTQEDLKPRAVQAELAVENSAAGTSSITVKLAEGGSESTVFTGNPASTTRAYKRGLLTAKPSGGEWTDTAFQNLLLRFGYTSDATPNPRLQAAMIEVLFGPESAPIRVAWLTA